MIEADGLEVDLAARVVRRARRGGPPHADRVRPPARARPQPRPPADAPRAAAGGVGPAYADDAPTLRTNIARLRRKLEPDGDAGPRYIRTDPGVGYRFDA